MGLEYEERAGEDEEGPAQKHDRDRAYGDRFADDIDNLNELGNLDVRSEDQARVELSSVRAMQALLLDANIRYGYENNDPLKFIFDALGVMNAFGLEAVDEGEDPTA
jgi:hypothetical protein